MKKTLYILFVCALGACTSPDATEDLPANSDSAISLTEPDGTEVEIEKPAQIIKADSSSDSAARIR